MSQDTPFAGLLRLSPGEPMDPRFLGDNIDVIDRMLQVGAVTHRHDAHAALANPDPDLELAVEIDPDGGTIPADLTIYVGYTWVDADGGETALSADALVSTAAGLVAPTDAPDAVVDHAAGGLTANTYTYGLTISDGLGGETELGSTIPVTVDPGYPHSQITLSGLATILADSEGTEWRLYRARGAGPFVHITSGSGDTVTDDDTLCPHCDEQPPQVGTTANTNRLLVPLPDGPWPTGVASLRLYGSVDGSFQGACLLGTYLPADAGVVKAFVALTLEDGQPPAANRSLPGAHQIDPDTELLDWHWKRPVAAVGDLPAADNTTGDVRLVTDDGTFWYWNGSDWVEPPAPSGGHTIVKPDDTPMTARGKLKFAGTAITSITDDSGGDQTVVTIDGGGGGGSPSYPIDTIIEWTIAGLGVLRLKGTVRNDFTLVGSSEFDGAAGSIGTGYALDGAGLAIPTSGANNTNAIWYPGVLDGPFFDGFVERQVTITSLNFTRTGVTIGFGRKGVFAWITSDGNLRLYWRDTDTSSDADFHLIAADPLPAAPSISDTYNIQLERTGNHYHATVFQGKAVVAECEGNLPGAMEADFGEGISLGVGMADRWSNPDAWTTDWLHATWYQYHRELWAYADGALGGTAERRLLDDVGERVNQFNGMAPPNGFAADWEDGDVIAQYRRDHDGYVTLGGKLKKTAGTAPASADVIGTLEAAARPAEAQLCAVATGDDDGVELGMVGIAVDGSVTWLDGRSTTPAVKSPYVSLDGISYRAA